MKYQMINAPDVIVNAVQFDPHRHPWPTGLIPHDPECKPKDMTWGYMDTIMGRVHVMATDYILDVVGNKRVHHREYFEDNFRPVIAPVTGAIVEKRQIGTPPQGGDATITVERKEKKLDRIRKYRTEKDMHQSLSNACQGKWRMCVPVQDSDDDMVLSDAIHELIERRKENPQRDEVKSALDHLFQQYESNMQRCLANHRITCDGALEAVRYEAKMRVIIEIADQLGIELSTEQEND